MALAQIKRRHDQEITELEGKIRSGDTKELFVAVTEQMDTSAKQSLAFLSPSPNLERA
ncbi:hypothetical protein BGZ99_004242, partial [Dissophora globulifera]